MDDYFVLYIKRESWSYDLSIKRDKTFYLMNIFKAKKHHINWKEREGPC